MDAILKRLARSSPGQSPRRFGHVSRRDRVSRAGRLLASFLTWQERARERHALASLDDRMLRDIGLSRADVFLESTKPFWRA